MSIQRIKIKENDLRIIPCNNKVLCKVEVIDGFDKKRGFYTSSTEWDNDGSTVTRYGEVVALPKKLLFKKKPGDLGLEWKTELEAQVGDIAYWGIMEGANCPLIECQGETYFLIDYSEIRLLKRGEEIIPVNGFILLSEAVEQSDSVIIAPESFKKTDKKRGVVKYIGKPNKCYYPDDYSDPKVNIGDTVLFRASMLTNLEDSRYAGIEEKLYYVQGRWVICSI